MDVVTYEMEVAATIPPTRIFKSFVLEGNTILPKVLPQAINSVDVLEGNGGPGTIKQINFGEGD
ncbi:hypothetical protein JCGZ_20016 [Jatropha curcas]|uniref:Bet v I/Major latex protein domain-containing protein n=1 Tax=Jatropha curcas TaxID=180498 RepID=A0A067K5D6_JATCU|nr:hypothetical protein JCGZ_20015 [Jatropha curcas]KDP27481.1 hypothetical protein JCGZ_20016 [Jatropha curcas]